MLTYDDLINDPEVLEAALAAARRARAEAVHELIVRPVNRLFDAPAAHPHLARMGGCSSPTS